MSDRETIEADTLMIVGGGFNRASLGPEGYEETRARVRASASECLDVFEERFLGLRFDARMQSEVYAAAFLEHFKDIAPDRVRAIAEHLLAQCDTVLVVFDEIAEKSMLDQMLPGETADFLFRLNDRREALRHLIGEL